MPLDSGQGVSAMHWQLPLVLLFFFTFVVNITRMHTCIDRGVIFCNSTASAARQKGQATHRSKTNEMVLGLFVRCVESVDDNRQGHSTAYEMPAQFHKSGGNSTSVVGCAALRRVNCTPRC